MSAQLNQATIGAELGHRYAQEVSAKLKLQPGASIDLLELFPQSPFRFALRNVMGWLLAMTAAGCAYYFLYERFGFWSFEKLILIGVGATILFVKFVYAYLYRLCLVFRIEGFRFHLSRGVLFRRVGSLPIVPFAEVYVTQDILDFICGCYHLHLMTALDPTKKFVAFNGLSKQTAFGLKAFFADFLNKQIYIPNADTVAEVVVPPVASSRGLRALAGGSPV